MCFTSSVEPGLFCSFDLFDVCVVHFRFENGTMMEMHVPLIEQGIRKYKILVKAFNATAAFHSAAEVAAVRGFKKHRLP